MIITKNGVPIEINKIELESREDLKSKFPQIRKNIEENGYCLLEPWNEEVETLSIISRSLGNTQKHVRSTRNDGIVGEDSSVETGYEREYQSSTDGELEFHTDGIFIDGIVREVNNDVNEYMEIKPPKMILLQVVTEENVVGGDNLLIDGKEIYLKLHKENPELLEFLCNEECMSICRDDQIAMKFPIFDKVGDKRFQIRFRYDHTTFIPKKYRAEIERFFNEYIKENEEGKIKLKLEKGKEILVVDNYRFLHAREKYTGTRKIRRAWINNDVQIKLERIAENLESTEEENRTLKRIGKYGKIENQCLLGGIKTGIRLSSFELLGIEEPSRENGYFELLEEQANIQVIFNDSMKKYRKIDEEKSRFEEKLRSVREEIGRGVEELLEVTSAIEQASLTWNR